MNRVILIAPIVRFDTNKAKSHGEIVYLFDDAREANPFNGQDLLREFIRRLIRVQYSPDDAIALTGPVAAVAMLLMAAADLVNEGTMKVLIHDARDGGSYRVRNLTPWEHSTSTEDL